MVEPIESEGKSAVISSQTASREPHALANWLSNSFGQRNGKVAKFQFLFFSVATLPHIISLSLSLFISACNKK